jgi:hypothetical protein
VLTLHRVPERREQFGHGTLGPQLVHARRCPERDDGLCGHRLSFGVTGSPVAQQVTGSPLLAEPLPPPKRSSY